MLPNIKKRCHAKCKASGVQCKNPAAYGCSTCHKHGARKPASIKKGKDCNFFKDGQDTRAMRKEHPAKLKAFKSYKKLLDSETPIKRLPETGDIAAKVINAEMDAIQQAYDAALISGKMPDFKKVADKAGLEVVKKYLKKAKPI